MGSLFYVPTVFAGILGPSNYEECVLDKMKGQSPNLLSTARSACLKNFPQEGVIATDRIKYTWCKSENTSASVCIEQIPFNVKITKIEGVFFEDKCDAKQLSKPGVKASATKPWYGTTYKFELPDGKRECAIFTFYGIEK
jgi:hypothetical protein